VNFHPIARPQYITGTSKQNKLYLIIKRQVYFSGPRNDLINVSPLLSRAMSHFTRCLFIRLQEENLVKK
jgi:hypothetical protein